MMFTLKGLNCPTFKASGPQTAHCDWSSDLLRTSPSHLALIKPGVKTAYQVSDPVGPVEEHRDRNQLNQLMLVP